MHKLHKDKTNETYAGAAYEYSCIIPVARGAIERAMEITEAFKPKKVPACNAIKTECFFKGRKYLTVVHFYPPITGKPFAVHA